MGLKRRRAGINNVTFQEDFKTRPNILPQFFLSNDTNSEIVSLLVHTIKSACWFSVIPIREFICGKSLFF